MAKKAEEQVAEEQVEDEDLFTIPTTLDPDTYLAKISNLTKKVWPGENKYNKDKPNESIMWEMSFARLNDDGSVDTVVDEYTDEPLTFEFSTSTAMSARSTGFKWATAFLRRAPKLEELGKLKGLLLGKKALVVIGQKENGFPKVEEVFPYMPGASGKPAS